MELRRQRNLSSYLRNELCNFVLKDLARHLSLFVPVEKNVDEVFGKLNPNPGAAWPCPLTKSQRLGETKICPKPSTSCTSLSLSVRGGA